MTQAEIIYILIFFLVMEFSERKEIIVSFPTHARGVSKDYWL